ncbi:MAG TPA: tetratricopeptide repeat protein [Candidatus Paceibacterota bacterium]|nr:tetratricopeptide repeat protein [Candidatus Paceibacterota bacterium]
MFILIPAVGIIASLAGIAYIVSRKMPYLKKLSPDIHERGETIFHDFFPEIVDWTRTIHLKEIRQAFLRETEKAVRRLRIASMKIDTAADNLIKRIRREHASGKMELQTLTEEAMMPAVPAAPSLPAAPTMEDLKAKEQQLIIEIAKNPKDIELYIALGDLYLEMHNTEEAKESYEAALALDPSNPELARKYSQLLKKTEVTV